jgi:hypothetical protein
MLALELIAERKIDIDPLLPELPRVVVCALRPASATLARRKLSLLFS